MRKVKPIGRRVPLRASFQNWRLGERGAGEMAAAIVVIPLMIALVFTLIEVAVAMHYRTRVDSVVQDTVRGVANDGAVYSVRTYTGPRGSRYEQSNRGWQEYGQEALTALCGTNSTRCDDPPTITCSPATLGEFAGETASCTATFYYKPVTGGLLDNPVMNLGFGGLWDDEGYSVRIDSITRVGAGGL